MIPASPNWFSVITMTRTSVFTAGKFYISVEWWWEEVLWSTEWGINWRGKSQSKLIGRQTKMHYQLLAMRESPCRGNRIETKGSQMVIVRGRRLETKPAVIPQHTSRCPAISYAYPPGPGQACAMWVYEDRKEHTFSFKTVQEIPAESFFLWMSSPCRHGWELR